MSSFPGAEAYFKEGGVKKTCMCVEMVQLRCEMQAPEEAGLKSNLAIQRAGV